MGIITYKPIKSDGWSDYALLDCGNKRKLERFGGVTLDRFEPDARWEPALDSHDWQTADYRYVPGKSDNAGQWQPDRHSAKDWELNLDKLKISLRLSKSRHIGIFPEQLENWRWLHETIKTRNEPIQVLNLFAYTGIATLYCAHAGACVTHVDASRSAVELGKKSQISSGLENKPIRWIIDDAKKFTQREIRRGNRYHGIILDPPLFGRGPKGEVWKFDEDMAELLTLLKELLSQRNGFILITAYNINLSSDRLAQFVAGMIPDKMGPIEHGPLIQISSSSRRELEQAVYVRWKSNEGVGG